MSYINVTHDGFTFTCDTLRETAMVTACEDEVGGTCTVPSHITKDGVNYTIEGIMAYTFSFMKNITHVVLPDTIKCIENHAFYEARNLVALNLPSSITFLGDYALAGTALVKVVLPPALTTVAEGLLYNCRYLTTVVVPGDVGQVGNIAFAKDRVLKQVVFEGDCPETKDAIYANSNHGLETVYYRGAKQWPQETDWDNRKLVCLLKEEA